MSSQYLLNSELYPEQVSMKISKNGNLVHQAWYLKLLLKYCYLFEQNGSIVLVPVKQSIIGINAFLPPGVQRLDPINTNHEINIENKLLEIIASKIPCGILSWSQNINLLPAGFYKVQRNNYILHLLPEYRQLRQNYTSGLKNSLNKNKHSVHFSIDAFQFAEFYLKNSNKIIPKAYKNSQLLSSIISTCLDKQYGFIKYVMDINKNPIAMAFFTQYNNRIVYLYSCSTSEGRSVDAMHAILDHTIHAYSGKDLYLDFEGSMVPGIAKFMQSFGATEEHYYLYSWNTHWNCKIKQVFRNWISQLRRN